MAKLQPVTGIAPSHWAPYFINGDPSGFDFSNTPTSNAGDLDKAHADAFAAYMGGPIVDCEDYGFCWHHDATQFGALASDCQTYTALIDTSEGEA
jgi:hypothetical protein